ncbi:bifunctional diguanylate cyclase/phosphodiesterase [Psychrobacter sp. P2G3]|uniref:putative bifunctional diguanylate cyclase/phosphodiesterase n=1 Tax=Psychrobacter sp. P2G3 TaxID=1699622 RepID=UPI00078C4465|nr:bifunctional diguanylate cyclase/phosphodiesterase [Psychrobacter sp. P2G3]AMN49500.1 diguanylate cyclase [Psychrobacter sp. P2G3]
MTTFVPISPSIKQQLLLELCECLEDAVFILDANLRYMSVNAAYEAMIGFEEPFMIGRPLGIYAAEFLSEKERSILQDISNQLDDDGFYENNFALLNRYGRTLNCHISYRRIYADETVYYVGMVRDISSVVEDQQQVAHLLNHNQLTGLPNRKVFLSQTNDVLMDSFQEVVIIRVNIDRYRILINNLGQDNVDALIKEFVARINGLELNQLLCFSHLGGDDFGLLFEFTDAHMVRHELDSLMHMCERPFVLNSTSIYLQISVGVSYYPKDGNQLSSLLNKAEKALQYAKEHGGDDVWWYNDELNCPSIDSMQLETELREAIVAKQFIAYYQPKVALDTGVITGFEALVRWQHPTRGLLQPKDFIEAIIKHKLSFDLFRQMAFQIAEQLCIWESMNFTQHVCINTDAAEFSHPEFFDFVSNLFTQYSIQPHQLHIEVTESSLMLRHASVKQQLIALKALGVCLALDDFGTGYASLSYLQEYPFDFIKIDKSFIDKIVDNRTQSAIVKAILDLAIALDMSAIAEGIETEQQRDLLLQMGCKYGQGYWFGRPVCADIATKMLRHSSLPNTDLN